MKALTPSLSRITGRGGKRADGVTAIDLWANVAQVDKQVVISIEFPPVADRSVHYEAAFEACLRDRKIPYVAVDEAKKALFANARLKSFDFVVYNKSGPNLLVDVKGRSLRNRSQRAGFETWATEQDVNDLMQWEQVFGEGFKAVLMFIYWIEAPITPDEGMFQHKDRWYLIMGIDLAEYRSHMRCRSAKWETVSLPAREFVSLARPLDSWV